MLLKESRREEKTKDKPIALKKRGRVRVKPQQSNKQEDRTMKKGWIIGIVCGVLIVAFIGFLVWWAAWVNKVDNYEYGY
jgi:hypothetical protein